MIRFRFQDLQIWQLSIELSDELFDLADKVELKKYFRIAEQLRGVILSISNNIAEGSGNIAEGSGSYSKKDFANFLNMSRRSVFEVVNILIILERRGFISKDILNVYIEKLDEISRKVSSFRNTLNT